MGTARSYVVGPPFLKWQVGLVVMRAIVGSNDFIRFSVSADADGVPVDPTGDVVEMAFLTGYDRPTDADFVPGEWDTTVIGSFVAQVRSGEAIPGDPAPGPLADGGRYSAWVRITAAGSGEIVLRNPGVVLA